MRIDILKRKDEIINWINENQPKSVICKHLKCKPETLELYLKKMNLIYKGNVGRCGFYRIEINDFLNNVRPIRSDALKNKLFKLNFKEKKCEECGITSWNDKIIIFELHHLDGDHFNNNLNNLKILCPNCHSQTNGFRQKKHIEND